jgi:glyoxylase-like metal-dependent hydrolase (beta-lactamase superfamily II)
VIALAAHNASEWTGPGGNITYLFPGPPSILVDAGVGHPAHLDAIEQALDAAPLDVLLITHSHSDHVAGIPMLAERWPGLVIRGELGDPLYDGELIDAGDTKLRAIHTPGHSPDHFCFRVESRNDICCGDLARLGGTVVIPATRGGNLRQYLDSLNRIRALHPSRLLPAHGPIVDHPAALIDEYLSHRQMREQQVLDALTAGATEVDDIVARIYVGLSATLRAAARETIVAHLEKLREEGRA